MDKFRNTYRIESTRLQNWDYRWDAAYFITLCTHNREHYFGEIVRDDTVTVETGHALSLQRLQLSPVGVIADILWHEIKNHATNVELGAFIVMPNHVHGILILSGNNVTDNVTDNVETGHALSLPQQQPQQPQPQTIGQSRFQNIGENSVSSIVGSYKSAVTRHAHRLGYHFEWQTRFYDHIIRNEQSFQKITDYIINNPAKWCDDKFFNDGEN